MNIIFLFLFFSLAITNCSLQAQNEEAIEDINALTAAVDTQSEEDPFDKPSASDPDDAGDKNTDDKSDKKKVKLKTYGFVKNNLFWDSRQVFAFRENDVLFWPLKFLPDKRGRDINAHPEIHILPIETLMGIELFGPPIRPGIRATGLIEGDFVGLYDFLTNQFRMRHAYLELEFEHSRTKLLTGQYWHPLFVLECFPETVSFNFGSPFDFISRQPQIRFTKATEHCQFILTALTERDFQSFGPGPLTTLIPVPTIAPIVDSIFPVFLDTRYKRNSAMPDIDLQLKVFHNKHVFGANFDFKRIVPRIVTDKNFKVNEYNNSFTAQIFARFQLDNGSVRMKCIFEQNGPANIMPGGYAIRTIDPITDKRTYSSLSWFATWIDTTYTLSKSRIDLGLFVAAAKNLGSFQALYINPKTNRPVVYGVGEDISYLWRISPRMVVNRLPFRFGLELEITTAGFGCIDQWDHVSNVRPVTNARLMLSTYYVF